MSKDNVSKNIGEIALIFFAFRDQLKIYHFQAELYSRHKSSDQLVNQITDKLDLFIETMQGSRDVRLKLPTNKTLKFVDQTEESVVNLLKYFSDWLVNVLPRYLYESETDLFNIRDEVLSNVNQALYLFTFK